MPNGRIEFMLGSAAVDNAGAVFREGNGGLDMCTLIESSTFGNWVIRAYVAGALVDSMTVVGPHIDGTKVRIDFAGDQVSVYFDDALTSTGVVTWNYNLNRTRHGMTAATTGGAHRWRYFTIGLPDDVQDWDLYLDTSSRLLYGPLQGSDWGAGIDLSEDTAAGILTKLLTVDGAGTGLDADLLDGLDSTAFVLGSTLTEQVQDVIGAAIAGAGLASASYNDGTGTTTITVNDPELVALAGLTSAANRVPYFTGSGTADLLTLDTDGTLASNSDTAVASVRAVKTYSDQLIAAADALVFKGVRDCSTNPNYPAADAGHSYRVSVAGKIGGGAGVNVEVGDILLCLVDGTAAGTQAAVGAAWSIAQTNIDGAVVGPASPRSRRCVRRGSPRP
jgi:hypothetical protein